MKPIKFSIIIVLYKSKHHLSRLLANISEVLPMVDDIILVDNSGEDLSEITDRHICIIQPKKNLGYGGAINCGIKVARNDNLIFANPDIEFKTFKFSPKVVNNNYFILSGRTHRMTSLPTFPQLEWDLIRIGLCNIGWIFGNLRHFFPSHPLEYTQGFAPADWIPGCLIITNKISMAALSGFDEKYFLFYEEVDLCRRAQELKMSIGIINQIEYKNFHGTSSSINVSEIKIQAEMKSFIRYHNKFNPGLWNNFCIRSLKFWCGITGMTMRIATFFLQQPKLSQKANRYLLYYRSLDMNQAMTTEKQ